MEHKRVSIMFITMMIVMVMGNFVVQTEAQASAFGKCFPGCIVSCAIEKKFPNAFICPLTCIMTCLAPAPPTSNIPSPSQMILDNKIDHTDYFCKLGCAIHHCAPISSLQNPNVDKVVDCVDSCSGRCSNKN